MAGYLSVMAFFMPRLLILATLAFGSLLPAPAMVAAQQLAEALPPVTLPADRASPEPGTGPSAATKAPPTRRLTRTETLDTLFAALKRESDVEKASAIADQIRREWHASDSPTVDLLMQWAAKAVADGKQASALDLYDQVIALKPDYVEGWNQRATLHYQMSNYRKSMSDINQVLALEPRHFGALAGMATILSSAGKDELALQAWEQFLSLYPAERKAQEQLGELEEKLAGNRT
jgi:tetratricopeptide (TPR) repeat protein